MAKGDKGNTGLDGRVGIHRPLKVLYFNLQGLLIKNFCSRLLECYWALLATLACAVGMLGASEVLSADRFQILRGLPITKHNFRHYNKVWLAFLFLKYKEVIGVVRYCHSRIFRCSQNYKNFATTCLYVSLISSSKSPLKAFRSSSGLLLIASRKKSPKEKCSMLS